MYFVISNVEAPEKTVRVLDVEGNTWRDVLVDDLVLLIMDGVLPVENATVQNGELVMLNGDLDRYGLVTPTPEGEKIDPVAVVISEVVDDNNTNLIIGYRLANCDGNIYDYSIEDAQTLFDECTLANAEAIKDENGVYWLKQPTHPYPIITLSALNGQKSFVYDDGKQPVDDAGVEEMVKVNNTVTAQDIVIGEVNDVKKDNIVPIAQDISLNDENRGIEIKQPHKRFGPLKTFAQLGHRDGDSVLIPSKDERPVQTNKVELDKVQEPVKVDSVRNEEPVKIEEPKSIETVAMDIPIEQVEVPKNEDNNAEIKHWVLEFTDGRVVSGKSSIFEENGIRGISQMGTLVMRNNSNQGACDETVRCITVPDSVETISGGTFSNLIALEEIRGNTNLKVVGDKSFAGCRKLVSFEGSPTKIGREAFNGCGNLKSINFRNMVTIGASAFSECKSLESCNLENIISIGNGAFMLTGVKHVSVGENLGAIGAFVFYNCPELEKVEFTDWDNSKDVFESGYDLFETWLKAKSGSARTIPGAATFFKCSKLIDVNIPEEAINKYRHYLFKDTSV